MVENSEYGENTEYDEYNEFEPRERNFHSDNHGYHSNHGPRQHQEQKNEKQNDDHNYYNQQTRYTPPYSGYYNDFSEFPSYSSSMYHNPYGPSSLTSENGKFSPWMTRNPGNSFYPKVSLTWGVGFAIFIILFFHYRDYSKKRHDQEYYDEQEDQTWQQKLYDYFEYLSFYISSIVSELHQFRLSIISPSESSEFNMINTIQRTNYSGENSILSFRKRELGFPNLPSNLPPLENILQPTSLLNGKSKSPSSTGHESNDNDEIEPAFLTEEEYPEGWLVFDSKTGQLAPLKKKNQEKDQCRHE